VLEFRKSLGQGLEIIQTLERGSARFSRRNALYSVAEQLINARLRRAYAGTMANNCQRANRDNESSTGRMATDWSVRSIVTRDYALFASRILCVAVYRSIRVISLPPLPRRRIITIRVISPVVKGCNEAESSSTSFAKSLRLVASERGTT